MRNRKALGGANLRGLYEIFFSATLICFSGSTKRLNVNSSGGDSDDYLRKSFFEPYLNMELS